MKISNIFNRRNRILLRELVVTDFKLRYQGSVLGYLWSLLKPLMLFAILYIVFIRFLKIGADIKHYPVYLLLGIVIWSFFVEATTQGLMAIVARGDLIRKINFPKYIIVISCTISALINFFLNLLVVLVFAAVNGVDFGWRAILVPFSVIELYIFALAIAFLLSALYVKYRDVSHIWEVFLQGAFYATPILYPMQMLLSSQNQLPAKMVMLNPIAQIVQDMRHNLITAQAITTNGLINNKLIASIPYIIIILTVVIATYYFKKNQKYFAERV